MNADARNAAETAIRAAFEAQDIERAATLAIEHYGPEILGFLTARCRSADAASDAFSIFSEQFWKALPSFEWRCSARTWAYKLAHRAVFQEFRRERRHGQEVPLTSPSRLSQAVAAVRTGTAAYQQTRVKDRFQELREQLPDEDQTLLVLRVDRGMSWLELAEVTMDTETPSSPDTLNREAARLRKRFQNAKQRLKQLAEAEGIL